MLFLSINVLLDNFIGYIARGGNEIATRPQMPTPELAGQFVKTFQHKAAGASFQALDKLTDSQMRWYGYEQVNMVGCNMYTHNLNIQRCTGFTHPLAQLFSDFAAQNRFTIFG